MTDRPILFSAPMVRALLAGTKTQTRRTTGMPVIEQKPGELTHIHNRGGGTLALGVPEDQIGKIAADYCTVQPCDRLWVKETWRAHHQFDGLAPSKLDVVARVQYSAGPFDLPMLAGKTRVSIHMPKWASRLTLHVTDVRVERLQAISDADAWAEGINTDDPPPRAGIDVDIDGEWWPGAARERYRTLWTAINGAGSWDANPWVVAITFAVERCNIGGARP